MSKENEECMGEFIIVREGPFRYLKDPKSLDCYSTEQKEARRFDTRAEAKRAARRWVTCYTSSYPVRVVKLVPARPNPIVQLQKLVEAHSKEIESIQVLVGRLLIKAGLKMKTRDRVESWGR